ncbi:MAG: response regulator [Bacteroidales bacterium]
MSEQPTKIRIVIADDHPIFREGLRRLLESEPGLDVVAQAGDGEEAVRSVAELRPDILLLDLAMPRAGGLQALETIQQQHLDVKTIVVTAEIDGDDVLAALRRGARGVVMKESATHLLFRSIRAVMNNEYWVGHGSMSNLVEALRESAQQREELPPAMQLTPRELQVVAAIVEGASNKDLSQQLGLSEQTVKNHLSRIFDKVGVSSRLELALYAVHHGLTETDK